MTQPASPRRGYGGSRRSPRANANAGGGGHPAYPFPSTMALFFDPKPRQLQSAAIDLAGAAVVRDEVHVAVRIGAASG